MKKTDYNGQYIGDSAVAFFDKLAKLESMDDYKQDRNSLFKGRYQIGVDVLKDLELIDKSVDHWNNVIFKGELAKKYKLTNKQSFFNSPEAQDEIVMLSIYKRWLYLKRYSDKICTQFNVPANAVYRRPNKKVADQVRLFTVLGEKKKQGYKTTDFRGKSMKLSSSGILAGSHLTGQGAVGNAIRTNCTGDYGIPCDGNNVPFYFYHENLSGYDLSVIIGFKDPCGISNVVLKNDSNKDKKQIDEKAKVTSKEPVKKSLETKVIPKENKEIKTEIKEEAVYEFRGQKYEEVADTEQYKKDREELTQDPKIVFVKADEAIIERLKEKFNDTKLYNQDYIKYVETKTKRKILEENKKDIEYILKVYDEKTKDKITDSGNIINQVNFDILRGREEVDKKIRIEDLIYYIYCNPIANKSKIETLEDVLSQYSARYVIYPEKKTINSVEKQKEYLVKNVENALETNQNNEVKVEKNELPEKYNKYLKGIKDIDEVEIKIEKVEIDKISQTSAFKLIKEIGGSEEYKKAYEKDEYGIYKYPIIRRLLDNIFIEFLKVQSGFKNENEKKYYDNHKYKDSNIVRNYILWYIKNYKGLIIPSKDPDNMFNRLSKLGQDTRVTTILKSWIESKSPIKVENVRRIEKYITNIYEKYRDETDKAKDKEIIHNLFKSQKDLRNYAANIDAMNIYSFYIDFYTIENTITPDKTMYVNDKCILRCTLGMDISKIIASENGVTLEGGVQLNIADKNIQPFKMCKAIKYCKPELAALWEKHTDVQVRGKPALLDIATIKCLHGGIISIDDAGQDKVGIAKSEIDKNGESKKDVDCTYKVMEKISEQINKEFMQTQLKEECIKFAKNVKEYGKLLKEINLKEIENIKRGILSDEMKKIPPEKINEKVRNIEKLKSEMSKEKEKEIRGKIFVTFNESYKRIKNISNPDFDSKGIIKKYGMAMCDHANQNFYNSKILSIIVLGYLMKSANLKESEEEKSEIEKVLNEINDKIETVEANKNKVLEGYAVGEKTTAQATVTEQSKITMAEIETWINIGGKLYAELKKAPTTVDIVEEIKKNGKVLVKCPFSLIQWQQVHGNSTTGNVSVNNVDNKTNSESTTKVELNVIQDSKNNSGNVSSVESNTKETAAQGQKVENKGNNIQKAPVTQATKNDNKTNSSSNDGSKKQEIPKANSTTTITNCPNCNVGERAPWMKIALEEYNKYKGLKETVNPLADRVREYHKIGSSLPKAGPETSWCASFVNWVLKQAKVKNWGTAAAQGVASSSNMVKTDKLVYGAIILLKNHNKATGVATWSGHVTFLVGTDKNGDYIGLGGNQSNQLKKSIYRRNGSSSPFTVGGVQVVQKFSGFYLPKDYVVKESDYLTEKDIYTNISLVGESTR